MTKPDKDYPFTLEEFHDIYSKVPRLTVEVVIKSDKGVLLSLRDIEPHKGAWHLPGGTVFFGEKLVDAVKRVAKRELGITVTGTKLLGYIEYPSHVGNGLDSPVGIAFLAKYEGTVKPNQEAAKLDWFSELPSNMHPDQDKFLQSKVLS
ncbi:MAG TPA: NUDIX domain-containing protein [Candidatus Saccharimonadales bacterium]|nr:NUDIX domain-containing protein [Candidatus Saccharimonadales bacterium]